MSTAQPTHTKRLAEIRERLEALTGVPAYSAVGNCYREDIPYLLERLAFAEDAVRTCADEGECPACWEAYYQGVAFGADRRTLPQLREENKQLRAALARLVPACARMGIRYSREDYGSEVTDEAIAAVAQGEAALAAVSEHA